MQRAGTWYAKGWHTVCKGLAHSMQRAGTQCAKGWHTVCKGLAHSVQRAGTQYEKIISFSKVHISNFDHEAHNY